MNDFRKTAGAEALRGVCVHLQLARYSVTSALGRTWTACLLLKAKLHGRILAYGRMFLLQAMTDQLLPKTRASPLGWTGWG